MRWTVVAGLVSDFFTPTDGLPSRYFTIPNLITSSKPWTLSCRGWPGRCALSRHPLRIDRQVVVSFVILPRLQPGDSWRRSGYPRLLAWEASPKGTLILAPRMIRAISQLSLGAMEEGY